MFSFFSSLMGKAPVKKIGLSVLALVLLTMALGSCKQEADEPTLLDKLKGEWEGQSDFAADKYIINENSLTYDDGFDFMSFSGTIKYVGVLTGEASGILIVQYTEPPAGHTPGWPLYNNPDGYQAVYFKGNVDTNILKFSCALDADTFAPVDTDSLDSAKQLFTGSDYFEKYIDTYAFDPDDSVWDHISDYIKK